MRKEADHRTAFSLRNRFVWSIVILIALAVSFSALQLRIMDNIFTYSAKQTMKSAADDILQMDFSSEDIHRNMAEIESSKTIYTEVYRDRENLIYTSNTNSWVYDADSGPDDSRSAALMPRIMEIVSHDDLDDGSYFEVRREHFSSASYVVYEKTEGDLTVVVFYSMHTIYDNSATAKVILLVVSAVFLIVTVTIISFYSRQIIRPVEIINDVTKRIARLDFSQRIPSFAVRDLKELGQNVNHLSDSLSGNLQTLRAANERLESDILKEKQADENRKQFIANASHELKTPIAIIQSYAEGIKYDDTHEKVEEYCDIILDESEKMTNLILRLMQVAKYDSEIFVPEFAPFDVDKWLTDFVAPYSLSAEKKGIDLRVEARSSAFGYGSSDMLSEILLNLISNAMSHCAGEKRILIRSELSDDKIKVSVFNSGSSIAPEDAPNIWESFYRADKAHSRAEGRFGLGLSIVRSIQEMHGEEYGFENTDDGVVFWFTIGKYENR